MRLTRNKFEKIIREEINKVLKEGFFQHAFDQFDFVRKATSWKNIPQNFPEEETKQELRELPILTSGDPGVNDGDAPTVTEFSEDVPKQFLYKRNGRVFLVQRGGYSYARYIAELRDFDPERSNGKFNTNGQSNGKF